MENSERKQNKNLKPFKKGQSGNIDGRPTGSKNHKTLVQEALASFAKRNGKTPEEIELLIYEQGIHQALNGDYVFYKDYMDRMYGKPSERDIKESTQFSICEILNNIEMDK